MIFSDAIGGKRARANIGDMVGEYFVIICGKTSRVNEFTSIQRVISIYDEGKGTSCLKTVAGYMIVWSDLVITEVFRDRIV